uniref:uncharacterized protein LOC122604444 n=1 Tax=Erigeron canadensis TaxID=72917 RepID=UPI001CB90A1F|nr:uncharacterized protein LOC122604444 [Erigeron canadensis]
MDRSIRFLSLLFFLVISFFCFAGTLAATANYTLHIKDKDIKDLTIGCEIPDWISGDIRLQPGKETKFQVYLLQQYDCIFKWQSREKLVTTFDDDTSIHCIGEVNKDCLWEVRVDGFWFYDKNNHWIKRDKW